MDDHHEPEEHGAGDYHADHRFSSCVIAGSFGAPATVMARMTDEDLEAFAIDAKRHLDAGHAWFLRAVEEIDRRGATERTHVLTTRQWLKRFCQMTGTAASAIVTSARGLVHMPDVAKRAVVGQVPRENITQIATARKRHPQEFPLHEPVFADIATTLDPRQMKIAIGHWEQQVDRVRAVRDGADRIDRRRMSLHQTIDGMWHHDGLYDPETGHLVATALKAVADRSNLDPDDRRSYGQRLVDALSEVCKFSLDNSDLRTSGGEKTHVTVTVDVDQLRAITDPRDSGRDTVADSAGQIGGDPTGDLPMLPEINGTPVSFETFRRMTCDAGIVRIVIGPDGQPLDVGRRQRTVTPAIRRALDHRDLGCRWDGCDLPASWCDAHHIHHWALGGVTSLDNLILLCRKHHTAIHDDRTRPRLRSYDTATVDRRPGPGRRRDHPPP